MQETRETSGVAPPSCDCNYGFLPNVQLHLQPGMAFAKTNDGSLRRAGSRQSPSTLCWRRRQAMSIADSVPAGLTDSCRSGFKRTSATGQLSEAAATGSIPDQVTRIIGSRAGCWSARSPTNLRSASNCSIRRPTRWRVCKQQALPFPFLVWKRAPARKRNE